MSDDWGPWSLRTSTRPSREAAWPTGSVIPMDVDDQAPIPLLVGIALLLVVGFVIIVYCICRRHNLLGGSSGQQDPNTAYQRAPTGDGTGGGYGGGVGVNAYPMAPVKSMFPPPSGPQTVVGLPGKPGMAGGGVNMGQHLQPPPHPFPSLPPDAYTPPYPIGYAPLPSYMPTSQSSHTSSASGPSSDQGPSGFSSSPPGPAPAPSGMVATPGGLVEPSGETAGPGPQPRGAETKPEGGTEFGAVSTPVTTQAVNPPGVVYTAGGFGGQGVQGHGTTPTGFQLAMADHRAMMGMGGGPGMGYGTELGQRVGTPGGSYPPTMHPTAMDYAPGGGFIPRVGSPMPPPGTTMTELDQL